MKIYLAGVKNGVGARENPVKAGIDAPDEPVLDGPAADTVAPSTEITVSGMLPLDWWVLALTLRGQSVAQIATITGTDRARIQSITEKAVFQEQLAVQSRVMIENITNGNYGVSQIARANAPDAMRRIIEHSRQNRDAKVSLMASKEILNYAGLQPVRRIETFAVDTLFPKMTPDELIHFAKTLELPDRMSEQAQQFRALPSPLDEARLARAKRIDPDDPAIEVVEDTG